MLHQFKGAFYLAIVDQKKQESWIWIQTRWHTEQIWVIAYLTENSCLSWRHPKEEANNSNLAGKVNNPLNGAVEEAEAQ